MGKGLFLAVIFPLLVCGNCARAGKNQTAPVSAAAARKGQSAWPTAKPTARNLQERYMPAAMADGMIKIAVLVNLPAGDQSRQFLEGCVSEGRSMGFTVDTFVSGADKSRCREIAAGIARADYDGLIFAYGETNVSPNGDNEFFFDMFKPIAAQGIKIVTFETFPPQNYSPPDGLIATFQNDAGLARLSLDVLLSSTRRYADRPVMVIRVGCDPGIPFLDRRTQVFNEYVRQGAMAEAAFVNVGGTENPDHAAWEELAAILPRFPPGSVDAIWTPYDKFAEGCVQALASMDRRDIKLVSIGISNDDIRAMQRHSETWLANVAVDPKLAGTVNMRILAAALAGETLPDTVSFAPQLLKAANLNSAINVVNIAVMVPAWGDSWGLFDHYPWMNNLKKAEEKYLRIPPMAAP